MKTYLDHFFDNPYKEGYIRYIELDGTCTYIKTEELKRILLEDLNALSNRHRS